LYGEERLVTYVKGLQTVVFRIEAIPLLCGLVRLKKMSTHQDEISEAGAQSYFVHAMAQ
jgi:hypothetical protein